MRDHFLFGAVALVLAFPAAAAQPGEDPVAARSMSFVPQAELSTGLEYQEGDYGTGETVETLSIPTTLRVGAGRFQLSASIPYVRVEAPGNVVGGSSARGLLGLPIIIDPTQPPTPRTRREGFGDLRLGAAYSLPTPGIGLAVTGQVKVPTASEDKGLGTGEMDFSVGAELSKSLGLVTPFVGVDYVMPGDPDDYDLRNSFAARAGLAAQLGGSLRGHVTYGYARSISALVPNEQQISTGINAGLGNNLSLGLYGSTGLSDGSADLGAGIQLGIRL